MNTFPVRAVLVAAALALVSAACSSAPAHPVGAQPSPTASIVPIPVTTEAAQLPAAGNAAAAVPYATAAPGVVLPDKALTPGHTVAGVTRAQVCTRGYGAAVPHPSYGDKSAVFAGYQIPWRQHASYELDALIPISLGGDNSRTNLWPQPADEHNGQLKDKVELRLRELVCAGTLALPDAQHALASNWWAAYQQYGAVTAQVVSAPGDRCATPAATALTFTAEPVVCATAPSGALRWGRPTTKPTHPASRTPLPSPSHT